MPGYVTILRRHLALVLLFGLAGLLLGVTAVALRDPVYRAVAEVQLEQVESPFRSSGGTRGDLTRALQTQIDIAQGDDVREAVRVELGSEPPVEVTAKGERDELQFIAEAETPARAATIANAWATAYVDVLRADADAEADRYLEAFERVYSKVYEQIAVLDARSATATGAARDQLQLQREVLVTQLKALAGRRTPEGTTSAAQILASPVRRAQAPDAAVPGRAPQLLVAGLLGGLVLGYLLACLKEARRDEVRSAEDVGVVSPGTPVLGPVHVPEDLAGLDEPTTAAEFQSLRGEVRALAGSASAPTAIAVMSAVGESPVSEIAAGLAVSLARAGGRVVLVDADLQHPALHTMFATAAEPGLAAVLGAGSPVGAALIPVHVGPGVDLLLLPAGSSESDDLLATPLFSELIRSLVADPDVDTVVIAASQLLGTPDALAVAEVSSSVLLIARARGTRRRQLRAALTRLSLAAPDMSAVVLATSDRSTRTRTRGRRLQRTEPTPPQPSTLPSGIEDRRRRSTSLSRDTAGRSR